MTATATTPVTRQPGSPWAILDAAAHLGISDRHLRRLIEEGRVRSIRLGRRVLLPDAEVVRVANEGT